MDTETDVKTVPSRPEMRSATSQASGTRKVIEEVVEVPGPLTEPVFRHIGQLLGQPLGRHKGWSTHFVFGPVSTRTADAVCAYLRAQAITHDRETTVRWSPQPGPARQLSTPASPPGHGQD